MCGLLVLRHLLILRRHLPHIAGWGAGGEAGPEGRWDSWLRLGLFVDV